MSIALVCMVALGRWSAGGVALDLGPPDSRRWTIYSWRGANGDDERERKLERGVLLTCLEG
jgi:hypothetical protein